MITRSRLWRWEVKLLVFDMGHVFVDFDWDVVSEGFCRISGKSKEELRRSFHRVAGLGYESGLITTEAFLAELNQYLETALTVEEFKALWTVTFRENAEMARLLSLLKARLPLYLLSNTNEIHFEHLESNFNVSRHFTEVILSYKVGCSKPDPNIYHEVLRRCGLPAESCLFIDDLEPNVAAARAVGMQAILFTGVEQLQNELLKLGLLT